MNTRPDPNGVSRALFGLEANWFRSAFRSNRNDLTRYALNLAQECKPVANRIQKVLEDANLKLALVATDL